MTEMENDSDGSTRQRSKGVNASVYSSTHQKSTNTVISHILILDMQAESVLLVSGSPVAVSRILPIAVFSRTVVILFVHPGIYRGINGILLRRKIFVVVRN